VGELTFGFKAGTNASDCQIGRRSGEKYRVSPIFCDTSMRLDEGIFAAFKERPKVELPNPNA